MASNGFVLAVHQFRFGCNLCRLSLAPTHSPVLFHFKGLMQIFIPIFSWRLLLLTFCTRQDYCKCTYIIKCTTPSVNHGPYYPRFECNFALQEEVLLSNLSFAWGICNLVQKVSSVMIRMNSRINYEVRIY